MEKLSVALEPRKIRRKVKKIYDIVFREGGSCI